MKEINIKKGRPLLNYVLLTAKKYTATELTDMYGGILPAGMVDQLKPYQTVVAISPKLNDPPFKIGDLVLINIQRYGQAKQKKNSLASAVDEMHDSYVQYNVPIVEMGGEEFLKLGDNDIEFIVDEYEFIEKEKSSLIELPKSNILIPGKHNTIIN